MIYPHYESAGYVMVFHRVVCEQVMADLANLTLVTYIMLIGLC